MPVTTIPNIALEVEIDFNGAPLTFECQISDAQITLPGFTAGSVTETACPDGKVGEPGTSENGSLTGNVFADPKDTGITWALAQLKKTGETFTYSATWWADQANTVAMKFSGTAQVNSFVLPFAKPGVGKHPLDLALITADIARPAAAVA